MTEYCETLSAVSAQNYGASLAVLWTNPREILCDGEASQHIYLYTHIDIRSVPTHKYE